MIGILPFLVQWLALSHLGSRNYQDHYNSAYQYSSPPKSHWALLSEFQQLPEDEIEGFLPQICNILLDRDTRDEYGLYEHFERILIQKCAGCLTFGMRVCGLLKAASASPVEGLFRNIYSTSTATLAKDERLRNLQDQCESATSQGHNLPYRVSQLRASYLRDQNFMLDTLANLGSELKVYPAGQRNYHLRNAICQLNKLLHTRMMTRGEGLDSDSVMQSDQSATLTPHMVAQSCPAAAAYSLHLPLQHSGDRVLRILQFVESECEVLPSKERCPYLIVAEMMEQPFSCKSQELYTQGHPLGAAIEDTITVRSMNPNRARDAIIRATDGYPYGRQQEELEYYQISRGDADPYRATRFNENVDMFARDPQPYPQIDLSEEVKESDLAFTDTFRGGSLSSVDNSSSDDTDVCGKILSSAVIDSSLPAIDKSSVKESIFLNTSDDPPSSSESIVSCGLDCEFDNPTHKLHHPHSLLPKHHHSQQLPEQQEQQQQPDNQYHNNQSQVEQKQQKVSIDTISEGFRGGRSEDDNHNYNQYNDNNINNNFVNNETKENIEIKQQYNNRDYDNIDDSQGQYPSQQYTPDPYSRETGPWGENKEGGDPSYRSNPGPYDGGQYQNNDRYNSNEYYPNTNDQYNRNQYNNDKNDQYSNAANNNDYSGIGMKKTFIKGRHICMNI
jgi:hypothetical protein